MILIVCGMIAENTTISRPVSVEKIRKKHFPRQSRRTKHFSHQNRRKRSTFSVPFPRKKYGKTFPAPIWTGNVFPSGFRGKPTENMSVAFPNRQEAQEINSNVHRVSNTRTKEPITPYVFPMSVCISNCPRYAAVVCRSRWMRT